MCKNDKPGCTPLQEKVRGRHAKREGEVPTDYSMCEIEENSVSGTRPDLASSDLTRLGYGIVAHYGAEATITDNRLHGNARRVGSFLRARISAE